MISLFTISCSCTSHPSSTAPVTTTVSVLPKTSEISPSQTPLKPGIWQPTPETPIHWQWQIGSPFNLSTDVISGVTVYDIDAFDNDASVISNLHNKGCLVIAYLDFGTYEDWRDDASSFTSTILGNSVDGWKGERWFDIRSESVRQIMGRRLDMVKQKGFDAVEPDNIDGYSNRTGFPLTAQDQIQYNKWIADECHKRGLSAGLKNDVEQAGDLVRYFDWALNEESYKYKEYSDLTVFTKANKAVFEVEYGNNAEQKVTMNMLHFNSMTRDLDLRSPVTSGYLRLPCVPDSQNSW